MVSPAISSAAWTAARIELRACSMSMIAPERTPRATWWPMPMTRGAPPSSRGEMKQHILVEPTSSAAIMSERNFAKAIVPLSSFSARPGGKSRLRSCRSIPSRVPARLLRGLLDGRRGLQANTVLDAQIDRDQAAVEQVVPLLVLREARPGQARQLLGQAQHDTVVEGQVPAALAHAPGERDALGKLGLLGEEADELRRVGGGALAGN